MDIRTMVGQRLGFGFKGTTLSNDFIDLVRKYRIGNVILFRENCVDSDQVRKLCADIQELVLEVTGEPAFITIDQEGGMVSRVPSDAVCVPGNMAVGAASDPEITYRMACITSRQLQGLGPNFNFAPSVDVNNNPANPVIGVRSYGDDPCVVAGHAAASIRGYRESGMLCCAKHFPGHGDTATDSHLGLPVIDKSLEELKRIELIPFREAILAEVPAIMSSHILFPQLEPDGVPATMSRRIMHDLLREEMGFEGLIVSDCMVMDAIRLHYGTAAGTIKAMQAGVDLVLVCHRPELQQETAETVLKAVESGEISYENMETSVERILAAKKKYAFTKADPELAGRPEDFAAARAAACAGAVLWSGRPAPVGPDSCFIGPRDLRQSNVANELSDAKRFTEYMRKTFNASGIECSENPDEAEIAGIVEKVAPYRNLILGTVSGYLCRGQLALAKALAGTGKPLTVIALRIPYDLLDIPDGAAGIAVFDYTPDGLYAAAEVLRTGTAAGKMPVRLTRNKE